MFLNELNEHLSMQKKRDIRTFKRVEERFKGYHREDRKFCKKAEDVRLAMEKYVFGYSEILKQYLDNPLSDMFFKRSFSQSIVISVLKDEEFVAFLLQTCLINRLLKMDYNTKGQIKLRIYWAIMCFDDYKKQKWSK